MYLAFRTALLLLNLDRVGETTFWEVAQAFIMGVRFDVVTIGFVIAIPTIILTVFSFFGKKSRLFELIYTWVLTVCFTITFGICAADIPYFDQFFDRFNITAFLSFAGLEMMSMVNPGEFCPIPYALLCVMMFIVVEKCNAVRQRQVRT